MTKKILFVITVIFFSAMLFLTFFAEKIHESMLPRVTAARPGRKPFPYEYIDENGNVIEGSVEKLAVPVSMLDSGVFVIYSAERNGTRRDFVRLAEIQTGDEADGFVEVVSGITFMDKIAADSSGRLFDGCEIIIEDKNQ